MARAEAHVTVDIGPAEAWADLLSGLHNVIDGDARDGQTVRDSVTALLEAFAARSPFIESRPAAGPRAWSLPAEPGPEVTAVTCDCHARRWHRDGPLWQGSGWRGEVYRWPGLLANHPNLVDATETGADR